MGASDVGVQKRSKKWRLFRATDYMSLMRPCFVLLRIYGLFPYKITSGTTIVTSKPGCVYSTVLTSLTIGLMGLVLYEMDVSHGLQYNSVPGYLQTNCYVLLASAIAVASYLLGSQRKRLLSDLAELSSRVPISSFSRIGWIIHAKDISGYMLLFAQAPNVYSAEQLALATKALAIHITLIVYLMDMLYVDCVIVLRVCFERINDNLLALKESMVTAEPHMLRRVYHEQKNPLIILELRALKRQHNDASEVVQRLNSTFSLQIVATVTLTFAEITFSLYFFIVQFIGTQSIDLKTEFWFHYFITSVTYYSIKMGVIVWACETAKAQATKTGIIVHEVLIDTTDKQVKEELQLFSLQLLHRDNSFEAKGLTIDATLITAIVGGITTYLLILIQFLVSEKSCVSGDRALGSPAPSVAP